MDRPWLCCVGNSVCVHMCACVCVHACVCVCVFYTFSWSQEVDGVAWFGSRRKPGLRADPCPGPSSASPHLCRPWLPWVPLTHCYNAEDQARSFSDEQGHKVTVMSGESVPTRNESPQPDRSITDGVPSAPWQSTLVT
jgi:hypothetical protein